jgi:hypothetical protein
VNVGYLVKVFIKLPNGKIALLEVFNPMFWQGNKKVVFPLTEFPTTHIVILEKVSGVL